MKKTVYLVILSIITVICVFVGCAIHIMGWFKGTFMYGLSGVKISHADMDLESFSGISVDVEVGDLTVMPTDGYGISYDCSERLVPEYRVEDGVLFVKSKANRKWWSNFWFFGKQKSTIVVTVPNDVYMEMISIKADVGDVNIENLRAEDLTVVMNVGDLDILRGEFKNTNINTDVGDVDVENTVFDNMEIYSDVGDVDVMVDGDLEDYDIKMSTDIGDISVNRDKKKKEYISEGKADKKIIIETHVGDSSLRN